MPRYLVSLFVALAASSCATTCTAPRDTIRASSGLCAALNLAGTYNMDLKLGCSSGNFLKSARDGKWYFCRESDVSDGIMGAVEASRCLNQPGNLMSEENGKILDAWAAGNTSVGSTPGVTDPVLTDTPTTPPPPPPETTFD